MATVEQTAPLRANFAKTNSPAHHKAVGRIGAWQLVRLISESELARVYQARPLNASADQGAAYVIKVLRKEWWRDPQAIEMQRRAAWIGQQLSHPHLLPILSAHVREAPYYLVSPRLHGTTLATILKQGQQKQAKGMPLPVTLWITRQVVEALAALHDSTGMIHADVKPSNIFVSPEGHATLIDFGFAHAPSEARHWSTRPVVGTLNYVAPEVVTSSLAAGVSCDLYSVGVTLYEMIAGCLPFTANAPDELVRLHREMTPESIRHSVPELPKPVASLVHRLLAKDPLRRPDSAAVVAEELMRLEIECFSTR